LEQWWPLVVNLQETKTYKAKSVWFNTYRFTTLAYALFFLILTLPYWGLSEVIGPHRQFSELAAADNTGATQLENRKFSDFTNGYIPEISAHLKGARSGWLTLWTDKNELGRPAYQISGFSPAYFPSWVIAHFTDSPWRFVTVLSLLTCFFAGAFVILFCREIARRLLAKLRCDKSFQPTVKKLRFFVVG